jgi:purine-binding chemotaxis protein CheW
MDERHEALQQAVQGRAQESAGADVADKEIQFVVVALAEQLYAFFGTSVTSIAKVRDIVPIPGTPPHLLGVMYHQGRVESVIDIKAILGLEAAPTTRKSRVVLADCGGLQCGILVDSVEDVTDLPAREIYAPLQTLDPALKELVTGETSYGGRNVVILDLVRLFSRFTGKGAGSA